MEVVSDVEPGVGQYVEKQVLIQEPTKCQVRSGSLGIYKTLCTNGTLFEIFLKVGWGGCLPNYCSCCKIYWTLLESIPTSKIKWIVGPISVDPLLPSKSFMQRRSRSQWRRASPSPAVKLFVRFRGA